MDRDHAAGLEVFQVGREGLLGEKVDGDRVAAEGVEGDEIKVLRLVLRELVLDGALDDGENDGLAVVGARVGERDGRFDDGEPVGDFDVGDDDGDREGALLVGVCEGAPDGFALDGDAVGTVLDGLAEGVKLVGGVGRSVGDEDGGPPHCTE